MVRKLELILGDALERKAKAVFGFGYAGSHHALATAIYACQLGLKSVSTRLRVSALRQTCRMTSDLDTNTVRLRTLRQQSLLKYFEFAIRESGVEMETLNMELLR